MRKHAKTVTSKGRGRRRIRGSKLYFKWKKKKDLQTSQKIIFEWSIIGFWVKKIKDFKKQLNLNQYFTSLVLFGTQFIEWFLYSLIHLYIHQIDFYIQQNDNFSFMCSSNDFYALNYNDYIVFIKLFVINKNGQQNVKKQVLISKRHPLSRTGVFCKRTNISEVGFKPKSVDNETDCLPF